MRMLREDRGFTLLEAVVSLSIATVLLTTLAAIMISTMHASLLARQNQQAGDLLNEQLESVRGIDYSAITMVNSSLSTTDPYLHTAAGGYTFDPGTGPEMIAGFTVGSINPYVKTITRNRVVYTVRTYVTCPGSIGQCINGNGPQARRVTVVVTWSSQGKAHERRDSTVVTDTRRGLPLPYFKFGRSTTIDANVGGPITLPVQLTNLGARDAWNLGATPGTGWQWWHDVNCNGVIDTSGTNPDVQMTTTNFDVDANGVVDTGRIETGSSPFCMLVRRTATSSDVGTTTVTLSATSVAQPTAPTATQSFTDTVKTAADYCPNCVSTVYYLHNGTTNTGNTSSVSAMPMNASAPTSATLWAYSTDLSASAGRLIQQGGAGASENNKNKVAVWQRQCKSGSTLVGGGYASVTLWALPAAGASAPGSVTVFVGSDRNGQISGFTSAGQATYYLNPWNSSGYQQFTVSVPISNLSIGNNDYLEVRAESSSPAGDMWFAYDTTTYLANAHVPLATSC